MFNDREDPHCHPREVFVAMPSPATSSAAASPADVVTDADAAAGQPVTASALPADVLDHIARQLGFCGWAALKYFWLLERAVLVPDGAPTINAAINAAGHDGVVLVRPGLYSESVRVTRDVLLCGLGPRGSVVVQPPGWEAAFVWGGYSVGQATVGSTVHKAASAGAHAHVRNVAVRLRNQQQQVAIYISSGAPSISDCDIQGTVLVAGPRCAPNISRCVIIVLRAHGAHAHVHSACAYMCIVRVHVHGVRACIVQVRARCMCMAGA